MIPPASINIDFSAIQARFHALLCHKISECEATQIPTLCPAVANKLLDRLGSLRLFAHSYSHIMNLTHGDYQPADLLDFAHRNALDGISIHLMDGEEHSLIQMSDDALRAFAQKTNDLQLAVHLEISSTKKTDVDRVVEVAHTLGVKNIRVYSRYEGRLFDVMKQIESDFVYLTQLADQYDLYFDFEQHEELKSAEILQLLQKINHPRLNALFDFGNMINACEQPLDALMTLAPYIRQVHLKGVRVVPEDHGFGHYGVLHGRNTDELPSPRLLFELLMLGEETPQIVAFILEQENHYWAPAFRKDNEELNPFIAYREMSQTDLPAGLTMAQMIAQEERWAIDQINYVRSLLKEFEILARLTIETSCFSTTH